MKIAVVLLSGGLDSATVLAMARELGYAQVGLSGLSRVQVWLQANGVEPPPGGRFFASAPWTDARILPPPAHWGGVPEGRIPAGTIGFDRATGQQPSR